MAEFLIEAIPFIVGVALGLMTFDRKVLPLTKAWRRIPLSLIFGTLQSWFAGELALDWASAAVAILFDSAAVWVSWAGVQFYLAWRARAHAR